MKMGNKQGLKELAARAKQRIREISVPKAEKDVSGENQDFAFLEHQIYREIVQRDSN